MSAMMGMPARWEPSWRQLAASRALRVGLGAALMLGTYLLLLALGIVELSVVHAGIS